MATLSRTNIGTVTNTPDSFWDSIEILLNKPHVVNKRLWGSKTLLSMKCCVNITNWKPPLRCARLQIGQDVKDFIRECFLELHLKVITSESEVIEIVLLELLPKVYSDNHAFQLVVIQKKQAIVTFYDVTPVNAKQSLTPDFVYSFRYVPKEIILVASCGKLTYSDRKSYQWLVNTILPQIVKWAEESSKKSEKQHICNESLIWVPSDKYYLKYNELKLKYGKEMVQIWPECTDPAKFVYEDISIATYLLLLWEEERNLLESKQLQTFVDLGCGNGLLVYILKKEGHNGVGIDIRKRQIWNMYPADVKLEEKTITPSDCNLFPDANWLIGNHSDELTPWIPVIAARSSYNCNFFLLPCCAYNFDGTKYQRQNSSKSQYMEYLQYIQQVCEGCGFRTDTDRLKIPSTKRICLLGRGRTYARENHEINSINIHNIIKPQEQFSKEDNNNESWIKDFKARGPIEKVRNCTQLDKTLIENIVKIISDFLLEGCSLNSDWNGGKTVELAQVVQIVTQENLKSLKSECGGLQTLLKNNHHIFKVENGKVQFRHPKTVDEVTKTFKESKNKKNIVKIRQKPCWFYGNHPQGCPLSDNNCSFLHVYKLPKTY